MRADVCEDELDVVLPCIPEFTVQVILDIGVGPPAPDAKST